MRKLSIKKKWLSKSFWQQSKSGMMMASAAMSINLKDRYETGLSTAHLKDTLMSVFKKSVIVQIYKFK